MLRDAHSRCMHVVVVHSWHPERKQTFCCLRLLGQKMLECVFRGIYSRGEKKYRAFTLLPFFLPPEYLSLSLFNLFFALHTQLLDCLATCVASRNFSRAQVRARMFSPPHGDVEFFLLPSKLTDRRHYYPLPTPEDEGWMEGICCLC